MKLVVRRSGPSLEEVDEALKLSGQNGLTARDYARKIRCDATRISKMLLRLYRLRKPAVKHEWIPTNNKEDYAIQHGRFWYAEQVPCEQTDNDVHSKRRLVLKLRKK